jgi:hypothetical protein
MAGDPARYSADVQGTSHIAYTLGFEPMTEEHARAIVMGPGDGQTVANPAGGGLTYKARSGQTGGALTGMEVLGPPLAESDAGP